MVARLMLNLRSEAERHSQSTGLGQATTFLRDNFNQSVTRSKRTFEETIMGNLGEEVTWWGEDDWKEDGHDVYRRQGDMIELVPRYQHTDEDVDPATYGLQRSW